MSLQKKIILSFLISSVLIAVLAIGGFVSFIEIRKEIRYLELSDTLRSKTLQLRRHEKNFLLYHESRELESVYAYIGDISSIISLNSTRRNSDKLKVLSAAVNGYKETFGRIERLDSEIREELGRLGTGPGTKMYLPVIEKTFLESPSVNSELITNVFRLKAEDRIIVLLAELDSGILRLRKEGEEILTLSKNLDSAARDTVEQVINYTQKALLIIFPLFLLVGLSALFVVSRSVVSQIKLITGAIEKAGKGDFSSLSVPHQQDEVGRLIDAFNKMEQDLIARDHEIERKNEELLQGRKLASIGTLASGVAHELNNPLNNIYLSAQILSKEIGDQEGCPSIVKETVGDINSQTLRVKRIVGDLLEFSREKPPDLQAINIVTVIDDVIEQMAASGEIGKIRHTVRTTGPTDLLADRHLMTQVFINLFTNAVQAMDAEGMLDIEVSGTDSEVRCRVSDSGPGIPVENLQRIFDPFYTTKGRGTGLGLAIVYNIIQKHKGRISAKSRMNHGTTFTLTIPRGL